MHVSRTSGRLCECRLVFFRSQEACCPNFDQSSSPASRTWICKPFSVHLRSQIITRYRRAQPARASLIQDKCRNCHVLDSDPNLSHQLSHLFTHTHI